MTLDWNEHPEARQEFLDAHARYLSIYDGGLGDAFVDEVERATALIVRWPDAPPPYRGFQRVPTVRTWHLGKFPYNLVYVVRDGQILVLAYAHEGRRPGYWHDRLN